MLSHVFFVTGTDLAKHIVISMLFRSSEKSCHPHEIRSQAWNVASILKSLTRPPYESLKQLPYRNVTFKTCFIVALASSKRVSKLLGFSYEVKHSRGWTSCTFNIVPEFVAKTQNPLILEQYFEKFTIPLLRDLVDYGREEVLLSLVRAVKHFLSTIEQYRPNC